MHYIDCSDKNMKRQKIYLKLLIGFFIFIFIFTVLSRALDSLTVAKVTVDKAKRGNLNHVTSADGIIESSKKIYIKADEGLVTEKINVTEGETVKEGEVLIVFDKKEIEEQLFKVRTELEVLQLQRQSLDLVAYDNEADEKVKKARVELERAKRDRDINKEINKGVEMEADKRDVEDAANSLAEAEKEKKKTDESNKILQGKNEIDKKTKDLEIMLKTKELEKLKKIYSKNNVLISEMDGVIDKIYIKEGEKTTGSHLISIIPDKSDYDFKATIDAEKAKYIKVGDGLKIFLQGKDLPVENVIIESMRAADDGNVEITAKLPDGTDAYNGMNASMKHELRTDEYNCIIPVGALRSDNVGDYILAVNEIKTVMGNEKSAVRVNVTVADKDNSFAAISSGLKDETVITDSNKPVYEGDRVRIKVQ